MKKLLIIITTFILIISPTLHAQEESADPFSYYDWVVVGAGFAGITALAVLIDNRVEPSTITWIDPEFNVGRVGKHYGNVPGNIQAQSLLYYVNNCPYFKNIQSSSLNNLYTIPDEEYPLLQVIVDPLIDFTHYLQDKVISKQNTVTSLSRIDNYWYLTMPDETIYAKKVILAIGAQPKRLDYGIEEISLDEAIDHNKLNQHLSPDDSIAVFGGMHSAMLILKNLSEYPLKKIINFYTDDYFFGAPGLEGETAKWVKEVLEKQPPKNLIRVKNTPLNRKAILPLCSKVIYAIGYEQTKILINESFDVMFNENTGIIEENLYGIGIAFPPMACLNGKKIAKNGLNAYLAYAKRLIPYWVSNDKACVKCNNATIPWI